MFELIQVGAKTYYIEGPVKIGIYKLSDTKVCLIDSGNDKFAAKKIAAIAESNGWTIEMIINTHSHADHCGGNALLQQRYGCKIYSAPVEATFITYPILEPAFLYGGYPDSSMRGKAFMAESSRCLPISREVLPDGLSYTYLNGHCSQMLGIHTDDDIWFLGDCVARPEILDKYHITVTLDVAEFLCTLDKISTLSGRLFIPSHTPVLENVEEIVALNRAKVAEICDVLLEICKTPKTQEEILRDIFAHYDMRHTPQQHALIGYTVRSYLSYLKDSEKLKTKIENGFLYYSAEENQS